MQQAAVKPLADGHGTPDRRRDDRGREAVLGAVGQLDGLLVGGKTDHRGHRPEDFILKRAHPWPHTAEHGGLVEQLVVFATRLQPCARLQAVADDLVHALQLPLVDQRAERGFTAGGIAHGQRPGLVHQLAREAFGDGFMGENQAGGHADLPLVQPGAPGGIARGQVEVGVFENDQRVLAAQFQRDFFQVSSGHFGDFAPRRRRPGERNHLHIRIAAQRLTRRRGTGQYLQQALGQARLLEQPGDEKTTADRGLRVGLEHHRIARRQGRGHRAQRQHQRKIER